MWINWQAADHVGIFAYDVIFCSLHQPDQEELQQIRGNSIIGRAYSVQTGIVCGRLNNIS